jgi:hypothetical protein
MLERLTDLPAGVDGLRARGKITKGDYDNVVRPLVDDARRDGRRLRLIYHLGPEFEGMTAGAVQEDIRLGIKHLYDFERCAVVSDVDGVRRATRAFGTIMPCPVKVFGNDQWDEAVRWVSSPPQAQRLSHRKIDEAGVVVVEPDGPLRAEDFDELGRSLDPWILQRGKLNGVVVHTHSFPGWENVGAFLRHVRFVRDHRDKTRRLALAADTPISKIAPSIVGRFVDAEVKRFGYEQLEQAIAWASGAERQPPKVAPSNGGRQQAASGA